MKEDDVVGVRLVDARPVSWRRLLRRERYEILHQDGTRRIGRFSDVDRLLDGRLLPADFWATIAQVRAAARDGDVRFVGHPSGKRFSPGIST